MKKIRPASVIGKTGKWALIILLAIFEIFPLIQLLFNSFRPDAEIKAHPLDCQPHGPWKTMLIPGWQAAMRKRF